MYISLDYRDVIMMDVLFLDFVLDEWFYWLIIEKELIDRLLFFYFYLLVVYEVGFFFFVFFCF